MDENKNDAIDSLQISNPWKVNEVSAFLKYCCPECAYNDSELNVFIEHAFENHEDSAVLFTGKSVFKDPKENAQNNEFDSKEECLDIETHSQTFVNHFDYDNQSIEFESDNTTAENDKKSTLLVENISEPVNQTAIKEHLVHNDLSKDDEINDQNLKSIPVAVTIKPKYGDKKCVIPFCQTRNTIGMHGFPKNPVQRELWIKLCRLKEITKLDKICSSHFKQRLLEVSKVSNCVKSIFTNVYKSQIYVRYFFKM